MTGSSSNINTQVTESLLAAMHAGTPPWVKPWNSPHAFQVPANAYNGRTYNGINVLILWAARIMNGYASNGWLTFNYMLKVNKENDATAHLKPKNPLIGYKKGDQAGTRIVHFDRFLPKQFEVRGKQVFEKKSGIPVDRRDAERTSCNVYSVFNLDQYVDLPEKIIGSTEPVDLSHRQPDMHTLMENYPGRVNFGGGEAFFNVEADVVNVPHSADFKSEEEFFSTLCHELVHSTRHPSRLDRGKTRGLKGYAYEELVAEIGASFMCAHFGIDPVLQHPAYLTHYIQQMEADHTAIVTAAGDAQKAVDYLLGHIPKTKTEAVPAAVAA